MIGERGTAQFTVTAHGVNMRNFVYQWRKKDSSLPNKVSGVNGAVLTIPNLVPSDEGVYYCTVTNEWGRSERSNDVTLSVFGMYSKSLGEECVNAKRVTISIESEPQERQPPICIIFT